MKALHIPLRLASASLLLLVASACASPPPPTGAATAPAATASIQASTPAPAASRADDLWQQIQAANRDTTCRSDSDCHTLGVGAKACGGPERYLAWSSQRSDGAALRQLVAQHAAARRADDARAAMMSTCSVVADPGASCRAGQCTLNPAAPFNGAAPAR